MQGQPREYTCAPLMPAIEPSSGLQTRGPARADPPSTGPASAQRSSGTDQRGLSPCWTPVTTVITPPIAMHTEQRQTRLLDDPSSCTPYKFNLQARGGLRLLQLHSQGLGCISTRCQSLQRHVARPLVRVSVQVLDQTPPLLLQRGGHLPEWKSSAAGWTITETPTR